MAKVEKQERLEVILGMCIEIEEMATRTASLFTELSKYIEEMKDEETENDFQYIIHTVEGDEDYICAFDAVEQLLKVLE